MGGFNEEYGCPFIKVSDFLHREARARVHHLGLEDVELGYRLKRAGYKIRLEKELQIKHLKRWDIVSLVKTDFFSRALPWTALILESKGFINDLNVKTSGRVSVFAVGLLLLTLPGSLFLPWLLLFSALLAILLLGLNWDLYRFFKKKRGLSFAIKAVPWHWFYLFYSGLGFAIGFASWHMKRLRGRFRVSLA
jgi:GT2 family glycosyltransferase